MYFVHVCIYVSTLMTNHHLTLITATPELWISHTRLTNCFSLSLLHSVNDTNICLVVQAENPSCPSHLSFPHLPYVMCLKPEPFSPPPLPPSQTEPPSSPSWVSMTATAHLPVPPWTPTAISLRWSQRKRWQVDPGCATHLLRTSCPHPSNFL